MGLFSNLFNSNNCNYYDDLDYAAIQRLENQYSNITKLHYKYIEEIGVLYTVANNLALPNSLEMQQVIDLCLKDIMLATKFAEYSKQLAILYKSEQKLYIDNYPSFRQLAIIYEKQKEYQKAADVCRLAIKLGFYKDGTTGQMPGRLARIIKKANKENIRITDGTEKYEYCRYCGKQIKQNSKFCNYCGNKTN